MLVHRRVPPPPAAICLRYPFLHLGGERQGESFEPTQQDHKVVWDLGTKGHQNQQYYSLYAIYTAAKYMNEFLYTRGCTWSTCIVCKLQVRKT